MEDSATQSLLYWFFLAMHDFQSLIFCLLSLSLLSSCHVNGGFADELRVRHPVVGILDSGEIAGARAGADVVEQVVVAFDLLAAADHGFSLIQQVAEGDGVGRAGVLAGGAHGIHRDAQRFGGDLDFG